MNQCIQYNSIYVSVIFNNLYKNKITTPGYKVILSFRNVSFERKLLEPLCNKRRMRAVCKIILQSRYLHTFGIQSVAKGTSKRNLPKSSLTTRLIRVAFASHPP